MNHTEALTVAARAGAHEQIARAPRPRKGSTGHRHYDLAIELYTGVTAAVRTWAELAAVA
jgi:hypothetical protein